MNGFHANFKSFAKLYGILLIIAIIMLIQNHSQTCDVSLNRKKTTPLNTTLLKTQLSVCLSQYSDEDFSIDVLPKILESLKDSSRLDCRIFLEQFERLYKVSSETGRLVIPDTFQAKVLKWLDGDKALLQSVKQQTMIYVHNPVFGHGTIYNPLRQKRPQPAPSQSEKIEIDKLASQTATDCDLCNYKHQSAEDVFGRLESPRAFTMANVFKLSAWHSLVVFKAHHPLNWSLADLKEVFTMAKHWFQKAHKISPDNKYPMILWDFLPGSGSSQPHPHIHVMLNRHQYYGEMDSWRVRAAEYGHTHGTSYLSDLLRVSSALGLLVTLGDAHAVIPLTSQIDKEVILVAQTYGEDLHKLLYYTIKVFSFHYHKYSFSMAMTLPPIDDRSPDIPVIARIAPRGPTVSKRSDVTSLHLFSAAEVDTDPFKLARMLREFVKQKQS